MPGRRETQILGEIENRTDSLADDGVEEVFDSFLAASLPKKSPPRLVEIDLGTSNRLYIRIPRPRFDPVVASEGPIGVAGRGVECD